MGDKNNQPYILLIVTDGFIESDLVSLMSHLREKEVCIKSISLANGLIEGAHHIQLKPDLNLNDVLADTRDIKGIILPHHPATFDQLETDPRLYRLLSQVINQAGCIITPPAGLELAQVVVGKQTILDMVDKHLTSPIVLYHPGLSPLEMAEMVMYKVVKI